MKTGISVTLLGKLKDAQVQTGEEILEESKGSEIESQKDSDSESIEGSEESSDSESIEGSEVDSVEGSEESSDSESIEGSEGFEDSEDSEDSEESSDSDSESVEGSESSKESIVSRNQDNKISYFPLTSNNVSKYNFSICNKSSKDNYDIMKRLFEKLSITNSTFTVDNPSNKYFKKLMMEDTSIKIDKMSKDTSDEKKVLVYTNEQFVLIQTDKDADTLVIHKKQTSDALEQDFYDNFITGSVTLQEYFNTIHDLDIQIDYIIVNGEKVMYC
jgi:cobalamin biosynthesis protein CobT